MAQQSGDHHTSRWRTTRLEAFSDGVFAVAVTLLVLDIAVPPGTQEDLLPALLELWPSYLALVVSFATVGALWLGHTVVTDHLDHVDAVFLRVNLLLLLVVALIPFPTRLLGASVAEDEGGGVATTLYGLMLLTAVALLSGLWRYARRAELVRGDTSEADAALLTRRLTPGLAFYLPMIALGLFLPVVAVLGYLAIAAFYLAPVHLLRSRRHRVMRSR